MSFMIDRDFIATLQKTLPLSAGDLSSLRKRIDEDCSRPYETTTTAIRALQDLQQFVQTESSHRKILLQLTDDIL